MLFDEKLQMAHRIMQKSDLVLFKRAQLQSSLLVSWRGMKWRLISDTVQYFFGYFTVILPTRYFMFCFYFRSLQFVENEQKLLRT